MEGIAQTFELTLVNRKTAPSLDMSKEIQNLNGAKINQAYRISIMREDRLDVFVQLILYLRM